MEERGVIDIQRDLADDRERVLAIFEIENPDVLGDQAAHRIERQAADRCFDAAFVKFFDDAVTPLPAEPALRQIPSAPGQRADGHEEKEAQGSRARSDATSIGAGKTGAPGMAESVPRVKEARGNVQRPTSNVQWFNEECSSTGACGEIAMR